MKLGYVDRLEPFKPKLKDVPRENLDQWVTNSSAPPRSLLTKSFQQSKKNEKILEDYKEPKTSWSHQKSRDQNLPSPVQNSIKYRCMLKVCGNKKPRPRVNKKQQKKSQIFIWKKYGLLLLKISLIVFYLSKLFGIWNFRKYVELF